MTNPMFDLLLAMVQTALEREDYDAAVELLHSHRPQDRANAISELEIKEQVALLSKLDETISADIIEDLLNLNFRLRGTIFPEAFLKNGSHD